MAFQMRAAWRTRLRELIDAGADVIDVGGQSTRPGRRSYFYRGRDEADDSSDSFGARTLERADLD